MTLIFVQIIVTEIDMEIFHRMVMVQIDSVVKGVELKR